MKEENRNSIYIINVFVIFVIFLTNILFNYWICAGTRVFYCDDLTVVTEFLNKSLKEFIFSTGANKFRLVSQTLIWIVLKLSEHYYELIDELLLLLNFVNALLVYSFIYIIMRRSSYLIRAILSCLCAIMFIASHFAYYNISEVLGIMEGIALCLAMSMLLMLYLFMESGRKVFFGWAVVLYALLIYTHERYFILFFLLVSTILFNKKMVAAQKWKAIISPLVVFVSFWGIRLFLFGNRAIDGTGGTSIGDTFNFLTAVKFCFSQVGYILGVNCGPRYLNGIEAGQVPIQINILLIFNIIVVAGITLSYVVLLIKDKAFRNENLKKSVLFVVFIGLCIICSSTTIRVEMRWIYVSYAAFLTMLYHMIYVLLEYNSLNFKKIFVISIYIASVLITEQFYRNNYFYLYYWDDKDMSREIYDVTIGKYASELEGKSIIIVGDFWKNDGRELAEWQNFFSPYINAESIDVIYAEDIFKASQLTEEYDNNIVLLEDKEKRTYIDITDKMELTGVKYLYGIYDDCWCDMNCAFEIRGNYKKAVLTLYYPDDLEIRGTPNGTIVINENVIDYDLTENLTTVEIDLPSQSLNMVGITANYWIYENTDRSEDGRLSNTLYIALE